MRTIYMVEIIDDLFSLIREYEFIPSNGLPCTRRLVSSPVWNLERLACTTAFGCVPAFTQWGESAKLLGCLWGPRELSPLSSLWVASDLTIYLMPHTRAG